MLIYYDYVKGLLQVMSV